MKKRYSLIFSPVLCVTLANSNLQAQNCASTSNYSYEWPSHRNWFIGAGSGWTASVINMQTVAVTEVGAPGVGAASGGGAIGVYEGQSSASDDKGNLLFYENGRNIYTGTGANATKTYSGLLEGNESGAIQSRASGAQGSIIVKHPLNSNIFSVFTTDDALSGATVGLNHFTVSSAGALISGPTRLGTFRTSEAIAATRHSNGIDIWIMTLDVTGKYNAYLLKYDGIDLVNSNLNQAGAPNIASSNQFERGSIAFSWDGAKMVQTHGNTNQSNQIILYDFNNKTGAVNTAAGLQIGAASALNYYDVIFSPDNKRIFINSQVKGLEYYDISSGVAATIKASVKQTGITAINPFSMCAIEIGASGKLYIASGNAYGGVLREINEDLNTSTTFTTRDIAGTTCSLGLPTMYMPPTEDAILDTVSVLCNDGAAVDLNAYWACSGKSAEDTTNYSGTGITNTTKGVFDPAIAGVGSHLIYFSRGGITDTLKITVNNCGPLSGDEIATNSIGAIYPNPTDGIVFLGIGNHSRFYNIFGELVLTTNSSSVDASHLPTGIYTVSITNAKNEVSTQKLIKK